MSRTYRNLSPKIMRKVFRAKRVNSWQLTGDHKSRFFNSNPKTYLKTRTARLQRAKERFAVYKFMTFDEEIVISPYKKVFDIESFD